MHNNENNINKANASAFREEIHSDVEANMVKFNDPVVLGELMYKLLEERENTNRILKNILAKLETMEAKTTTAGVAQYMPTEEQPMIPEVDEKIIDLVRKVGKVTAEDVKKEFNYKGKNAASARLNRLYEMNLLQKKQVGKKVFFFLYTHLK
jgi:predicted transcriptional regulator